jgi:hypothetical protein
MSFYPSNVGRRKIDSQIDREGGGSSPKDKKSNAVSKWIVDLFNEVLSE